MVGSIDARRRGTLKSQTDGTASTHDDADALVLDIGAQHDVVEERARWTRVVMSWPFWSMSGLTSGTPPHRIGGGPGDRQWVNLIHIGPLPVPRGPWCKTSFVIRSVP